MTQAATDDDGGPGDRLTTRIVRLGRALRLRGVDVALAELIDAGRAATAVDVGSRDQLRTALRATLVKDARHDAAFDAAFDRLFPRRPPPTGDLDRRPETDRDGLAAALAAGAPLDDLALGLVDAHAGLEGELRGERHHVHRVHRAADLARLMTEARRHRPDLGTAELRARIDELKRLIAADVRGQLGDRSPDDAEDSIAPDIVDVEFLAASRAELDAMRAAIRPLARRLAARLARRRWHRHRGRVNFRRTVRRSLATGGVPFDVALERPRARHADLFVLCDVSGSVAEFSLFTLTLMSSLSQEIARTRSFIFVDAVDEVTGLLVGTDHGIEPWQLLRSTDVVAVDGHSDYGRVLRRFWDDTAAHDLRPTSTVLITGDGRTNHRDPGLDALRRIEDRCRRIVWFNPEPRDDWGTHDSEIDAYGRHVSGVHEVRNLRQLVTAIESVL